MAKKLSLEETLGQGGTIETQKRLAGARRRLVNELGANLFAHSGFTEQDDRERTVGDPLEEPAHPQHRVVADNEAARRGSFAQGGVLGELATEKSIDGDAVARATDDGRTHAEIALEQQLARKLDPCVWRGWAWCRKGAPRIALEAPLAMRSSCLSVDARSKCTACAPEPSLDLEARYRESGLTFCGSLALLLDADLEERSIAGAPQLLHEPAILNHQQHRTQIDHVAPGRLHLGRSA